MSPFPDEVDVFTGPHWRMKQLVGMYSDKLSKTNFSNNKDFRSFLTSLLATFKEFKMHEQIENECIMGRLQQRCCTVHDVHSDNQLSDMLLLFEKGLHSVKSEYEQLNYARQLKERLEAFTQDFLPHMKEEEEVFQPMLMQYFTYEELKNIKKQVMAQHCSHDVLKGFSLWSHEELQKVFKYAHHEKTLYVEVKEKSSVNISQLPAEVLLRIFQSLSPQDLCRCSQVCLSWSELAKTGSLWRHMYPVRWARGDYYCGPPGGLDQEPGDDWVKSREKEVRAYQQWDEDADIDESADESMDMKNLAINNICREKKVINGIINNLLPAVGSYVKSVVLAYASTISCKMVRQILSLCPNMSHLDLTQTDVTDLTFDSWSSLGACSWLEHVDLSGCEKISDETLKKLSLGLGDVFSPPQQNFLHGAVQPHPCRRQALVFKAGSGGLTSTPVWLLDPSKPADIEDSAEWTRQTGLFLPGLCCCRRSRRRGHGTVPSTASYLHLATLDVCGHSACCAANIRTSKAAAGSRTCSPARTKACRRALKFLSLSGCYQVSDSGLRALSQRGGLPVLEHLNLSGCLFVTEAGLQDLVSVCPALNDEHFYYCDNINGPNADTASGCQNLQCGFRACCRSGE
ncbi:F-box/LRR-repeat protein 5 isoform X1 [Nerophis lumbriciformis]|uniref:F-box/LRR-repeat protein 5 isoform X1 n=1 Tax=Nerophis lumbriciformis TaxID=546530 RepID=UPI002ADFDAF7|nr:F-box/LRR-repeat protein 5-like isoform X1 [Nerophis lumbriciformis]